MRIKNWSVKDISFHVSERIKATNFIVKLINNGWMLNEGVINEDQLIEGDLSVESADIEEIQLIKVENINV